MFSWKKMKNINITWLKKTPYLELWKFLHTIRLQELFVSYHSLKALSSNLEAHQIVFLFSPLKHAFKHSSEVAVAASNL